MDGTLTGTIFWGLSRPRSNCNKRIVPTPLDLQDRSLTIRCSLMIYLGHLFLEVGVLLLCKRCSQLIISFPNNGSIILLILVQGQKHKALNKNQTHIQGLKDFILNHYTTEGRVKTLTVLRFTARSKILDPHWGSILLNWSA